MIRQRHPLRVAREAKHWSIEALAEKAGLSRRTILRAEQGHGLNPDSRRLLSQVLGMSAEELGLAPRQRGRSQERSFGPSDTDLDDMTRREFLRLLSLAGALLAVPPQEGNLDWERLDYYAERAGGLDDDVIKQYEALNGHLWRVFASSKSKGATFNMVRQQLEVLTRHLEQTHVAVTHRQVCALAGDLLQLAGEIFFDADQYHHAAQCYTAAASASKEANAFDLWACAMTRHAFIGVYERRFDSAVLLLELADRLAHKGDSSLSTRHWVNAVRAQASAGLGELHACEQATGLAAQVLRLNGQVHNGGWLRFEGARLAEERGACLVGLRQPSLAEAALTEALGQGLSLRRRGIVLSDLAMVGVLRRDPDQLTAYATAALDIARETGSGVVARKLRGLLTHLGPFLTNRNVRQLNEQLVVSTRPSDA
jgi:transcriptional regulator with XRE-family HTH domain